MLTSSGKVAVESATHARYISLYPDLFFEWDDPAPPFNEDLYEARRLSIMQILDKWHASKSIGEVPPFTVSFYDPSTPTSKPNAFAAIRDSDKDLYSKSDLSDAEKLRFNISPEVIANADSAAAVIISKTITDIDLASELSRRYNRSGRTLLRSESAQSKLDMTDEAGSFIHDTADLVLRAGPASVSVGAYNLMAGQYLRLCRSVPDHLRRSDAVLADALAASVKHMGEKIALKLEIKIDLRDARRSLWKTQNAIRLVLSEQQLDHAKSALNASNGLSLLSTTKDTIKDTNQRETITEWSKGMNPCKHCGKNHLHRDCKKKKPKPTPPNSDKDKDADGKGLISHSDKAEHAQYFETADVCEVESRIASAFFSIDSTTVELDSEPDTDSANTGAKTLASMATAPRNLRSTADGEPARWLHGPTQRAQTSDDDDDDQPEPSTSAPPGLLPPSILAAPNGGLPPSLANAVAAATPPVLPTACQDPAPTAEPAPQVLYVRRDLPPPPDDEKQLYVVSTSDMPGIYYGTFLDPDHISMVVHGLAPPAGTPATRKVKRGDLAAAYDLCCRQGTPTIFRGPWTVPYYESISVGSHLTSRPLVTPDEPPDSAWCPPLTRGRAQTERHFPEDGPQPDYGETWSDDSDADSVDTVEESDSPAADEQGGNTPDSHPEQFARLAPGASQPPGSKHISTSIDGARSYMRGSTIYVIPPLIKSRSKSTRTHSDRERSNGSFWLGVSTALNILALLSAAVAAFAFAKFRDAGDLPPISLPSIPSFILPVQNASYLLAAVALSLGPLLLRRQGKSPGGSAPSYSRASTRQHSPYLKGTKEERATFSRTPPDLEAAFCRAVAQGNPLWFCGTLLAYWCAHAVIRSFARLLKVDYSGMRIDTAATSAQHSLLCTPGNLARGGIQCHPPLLTIAKAQPPHL